MSSDFDFEPIEVLTFDCYGTLMDWESGAPDTAWFAKLALA